MKSKIKNGLACWEEDVGLYEFIQDFIFNGWAKGDGVPCYWMVLK